MTPTPTNTAARVSRAALVCGLLTCLGGLTALVGRAADIPRLTDWLNDGINMLPNTAAGVLLAGCGVVALALDRRRMAALFGVVTLLVGGATLLQYATGADFGIDTLLFHRDWGQRATSVPGRMGVPACVSLSVLGSALALAAAGRQARQAAAVGGLVAVAIGSFSFIGYLFGADALYTLGPITAIARQTATSVLLLGVGIVLALGETQPVRLLRERSAAGGLMRRALPVVVLLPVVAGWLALRGLESKAVDPTAAMSLLVLSLIALLTALMGWAASAVRAHEARLAAHERYLRLVTDNAPVALAHCDAQGRYRFVNRHYAERFGLAPAQVIGRHLSEVIGPMAYAEIEPRVLAALAGHAVEFEVELAYTSGGAQFVHCAYTPEHDAEGRVVGLVAAIINISDRRRAEHDLAEAARRKDEFLATLAHELRNPLAPIRNMLELLKRPDLDATLREQARSTMDRQSSQLVRLIDDLLDVSRVTRGKLELRRQRVELGPVLEQALEACRPLADEARHELRVTLPPQPVPLHADGARLAQVFGNLLTNAIKYTEKGGRVSLTAEREGSDIVVTIRDDGLGIPPDMLPHVFELFTQVDRTLERSQGGLGIGLTLVKRLVEMHDGSVTASSAGLGQGSAFTVRLPVLLDAAPAPAVPAAEAHGVRAEPRRILVVDDNLDAGASLSLLLQHAGHQTWMASDGEQALQRAEAFRPDAILLDIGLPRRNGYDVCRELRTRPWARGILIVALTGWGQDADRRRSREAGFDEHLVKPVDPELLAQLLARRRTPPPHAGTAG